MKETGICLSETFREIYDRLALEHGYKTREDAKEFYKKPRHDKFMAAVMKELLKD